MFDPKVVYNPPMITIKNFPVSRFSNDAQKVFKTSRLMKLFESSFIFFGKSSIKLHHFFIPELVYILYHLNAPIYRKISNEILMNTWMYDTIRTHSNITDMSLIEKDFVFKLKLYQREFIELYDSKKQQYHLNGYLLAFEMGLGKTFTSLALMHSLKKDAVIIIAPKTGLVSVWKNEIDKVFKQKQEIWVVGDKPKKAKYYITNYESIDKLSLIMNEVFRANNVGIIVDESHNFRNTDAKRVINLLGIAKSTRCKDILMLSGTPIKALGSEIVPTLELIDPYFDEEAKKIFVKVFGLNTLVAVDIVRNRLGMIMHRKTKDEVEKLPKKTNMEVKIKFAGSDKYTLDNVKTKVLDFIGERKLHYTTTFKEHVNNYNECMSYAYLKLGSNSPDMIKYNEIITELKRYGYSNMDRDQVERVAWANRYERDKIRPNLTNELKKKFDKSRAVVKYVDMKIMGEVLGGLLNNMRSEMFSQMIEHSPLCEIINKSLKKTICFTTYTDVVRTADNYVRTKCGKNPILVYGETSSIIKDNLIKFRANSEINPLIATVQTMSTGVTLIEANTVIFLNQPWRFVDQEQAANRVYRIGQDTDVFVYTFILDTGNQPNLSTRMEDIVSWSKDMFKGIIGDSGVEATSKLYESLLYDNSVNEGDVLYEHISYRIGQ
jgi:SNF2 family DNA or RNA helicase